MSIILMFFIGTLLGKYCEFNCNNNWLCFPWKIPFITCVFLQSSVGGGEFIMRERALPGIKW
ncbi:hypothetical protein COL91_27185 [Bacillus pseudomycoides]|nr:hypothetical protein COO02_23505 [Bacillus pseudomycoides]PEI90845.1 hypothetical protein CN679_16110 [Bacillus pseudomycoides]PGA81768.1 hypothetical protein COL91_27185 [Bacillus pseudomycoides]PHF35704.1 hypothetical protein COF72_25175 [Bacillus pseudomycoides]